MNSGSDKKTSFSFKNLPWLWIVLCIIFSVGALIIVSRYGGELSPAGVALDKSERAVTLYFISEDGKLLSKEAGAIKRGTPEAELNSLIEKLLKGSFGPLGRTIPVGTSVKGVKVAGDVASINFSGHIKTKHWGGSTGELLTIYSIVNSVTANFTQFKKVQILIEGERFDTLSGHIRIDRALGPKSSMIERKEG